VYLALGLCYHGGVKGLPMLLLVLAAIAAYSMSLAPVTWVVISEIFPNRIRGAAMSLAVAALWVACFILTYTFPILNKGFGDSAGGIAQFLTGIMPWMKKGLGADGTFWLYGAICVLGFLFILVALPETKGKTLEQIERDLVGAGKNSAQP
jgi:hypothetical protein